MTPQRGDGLAPWNERGGASTLTYTAAPSKIPEAAVAIMSETKPSVYGLNSALNGRNRGSDYRA